MALALLLALPADAPAKSKPITGKLSKRGYTVIALDARGFAKSVRAKPKFKLRPTANKVTLQLRAPNGTYAGPIVFVGDKDGKAKKSKKRKKSKRAIVGVKAGANLGKVKVKAGFAVAKGVAKRSLDTKRTATAKKGVPIGAGNFGRVAVAKLKGPSADRDLDGIPAPVDIDDDGDLVLDDIDRDSAGGARAAQAEPGSGAALFTQLNHLGEVLTTQGVQNVQESAQPLSANAPGISDAEIERDLRRDGVLVTTTDAPEHPFISGELDCRGLTYCSAPSTGRRIPAPSDLNNPQPFPACCDPDGDGLGSLDTNFGPSGAGVGIALLHGASPEEIHAGQELLLKVSCRSQCPGRLAEQTGTLKTVFATTPALASYTDEAGVTHPISYPIAPGTVLPVKDGPDPGSDVSVRFNLWRPQRRPVPKELTDTTGKWIDIGRLNHYASRDQGTRGACPQSSYSEADPVLQPSQQQFGPDSVFVFMDQARDQLANRDSTFSYTLNITQCYAGVHGFNPGDVLGVAFIGALPYTPVNPAISAAGAYLFRNQP